MNLTMSFFNYYFREGIHHILTLEASDHIMFVVALMAIYQLKDWRRVLILITAFTIGHSLTLALSGLGVVSFKTNVVELLVAVTVFLTGAVNLGQKLPMATRLSRAAKLLRYGIAFAFGLIHGLAFSGRLRGMFSDNDFLWPLLGFNLGLEIGQIVIVLLILLLSFIFTRLLQKKEHDWNVLLSGAAMGISLFLILQRIQTV